MGVPFFWWLIKKYPSVIVDCKETKHFDQESGKNVYEDAMLPNPNVVEFDNLYVDLNGIINLCFYPKNKPPPKNEEEMVIAIYDCLDRILSIVRPRKLFYLAIDGVAPKAKMNKQRSRCYKTAKETLNRNLKSERMREELIIRDCRIPPEQEEIESFDLNCINPGTHFMERLIKCLHFYIHDRINNTAAWNEIKVIFSDAHVPGEARHKIMDFIRKQRFQPNHDPNSQHVVCGADADLIMLGLATHEPNITIIREEMLLSAAPDLCDVCDQFNHDLKNCIGLTDFQKPIGSKLYPDKTEVKFVFLRLSYLRAYLRKTLEVYNVQFHYNFERALDDWICLSFLVDNDFLPPLLCLEIREGAIDRLVDLYKRCVHQTGGYLTDAGEIVLERLEIILADLASVENHIFKDRNDEDVKRKQMKLRREEKNNIDKSSTALKGAQTFTSSRGILKQRNLTSSLNLQSNYDGDDYDGNNIDEQEDEVRLWQHGFKDRYYHTKFKAGPDDLCFRYTVALQYIRGLSWILKYCYQGCPSWTWYFPYHHAPFASDFAVLQGLSTAFERGSKPLSPFQQLMSILPAASSYLVPRPWASLMLDPNSPIIDMYPMDFFIDIERKNDACLAFSLLPFVDERRLNGILQIYYKQLNHEELRRDKQGEMRLYLNKLHPKSNLLVYLLKMLDYKKEASFLADGMLGTVLMAKEIIPLHGSLVCPFPESPKITNNETITVRFRDPKYPEDFKFPSMRLSKAVDPHCVLLQETRKKQYYNAAKGFRGIWSQSYPAPGGPRMLHYHNNGHQQYSPRPALNIFKYYNNYTQGKLCHYQQPQQQQVVSTGGRVFMSNPPNVMMMQHPQKPHHQQQLQYTNAYWSGPGYQNKNKNLTRRQDGTALNQDMRFQKGGCYPKENDPNIQQQQQTFVNPFSTGGKQGYKSNHKSQSQRQINETGPNSWKASNSKNLK